MSTPHIEASIGDFAKTVLMPGDPLRAKFAAEKFLKNVKLVNSVRGMLGYTGEFQGVSVSIMASGMGQPSIGIYSYELFNFFGVENIIRVGTAGAIDKSLKVGDIVIAQGACTNSNYAAQFELPGTFCPIADFELLRRSEEVCKKRGVRYKVGNVLSSDMFYDDSDSGMLWGKMGVLAVEMEAAALYCNAARAGKRALAICTVSDSLAGGESATSKQRETAFAEMFEIALITAK